MSHWFRYYEEALDDPKIQKLPPALFKTWVNILCVASKHKGELPPVSDLAFRLRMDEDALTVAIADLTSRGLLDDEDDALSPHNWDSRQFKSDSPNERVKKFRDKRRQPKQECNVTETAPVTPPEQKQTTEPEPNNHTGAPRDLDWVRSKLLAVGGVALSETATLVLSEPLRWLREGCDLDADVLPVIAARCRGQPRDRFKNLSYFSAAVFEARDRRLTPAPAKAPRHAEQQPRKSTHDRIGAILGRQSGGDDHEDRGGYSDPASGPIIDALAERLPHHAGQGAEIIAIGAPRR